MGLDISVFNPSEEAAKYYGGDAETLTLIFGKVFNFSYIVIY
jgi:hypothetical protein